jgi:heme/copper-type cytochrome/quinol oxidase subunit 2
MNKLFIVPILSLFLILIPAIGIFLCILVIVIWFLVKYNSIYEALVEVNNKHDVEEYVKTETIPEINTKKYKRQELSESEANKGK